jgi:hypothetical protein
MAGYLLGMFVFSPQVEVVLIGVHFFPVDGHGSIECE